MKNLSRNIQEEEIEMLLRSYNGANAPLFKF